MYQPQCQPQFPRKARCQGEVRGRGARAGGPPGGSVSAAHVSSTMLRSSGATSGASAIAGPLSGSSPTPGPTPPPPVPPGALSGEVQKKKKILPLLRGEKKAPARSSRGPPERMGVPGLWRAAQEGCAARGPPGEGGLRVLGGPGVGHRELLAQLEGRVLAVDLALWACQATGAESGQVFLRGRHIVGAEGAAVKLCMERATNLLRYGAIPIGVVEGSTPAAKAGALRLRQGKGSRGAADARGGRCEGRQNDRERFTEAARITRAMAAALAAAGIPVAQAPGESEAFCAALVEAGVADAVVTDDIDAVVYAAPAVLRSLRTHVSCPEKSGAVLVTRSGFLEALGLNGKMGGKAAREALAALASLAGHDYGLKGRQRVGPKKAAKLVHRADPEFESILLDSDGTLGCYRELRRQWHLAWTAALKFKQGGDTVGWSRPDASRLQAALREGRTGLPWSVEQCRLSLLPLLVLWDAEHRNCASPEKLKQREFDLEGIRRQSGRSGTAGVEAWMYEMRIAPARGCGRYSSVCEEVELLNSVLERSKLRHHVRMSLVSRNYPELHVQFQKESQRRSERQRRPQSRGRPSDPSQKPITDMFPKVRSMTADGQPPPLDGAKAAQRLRCVEKGLLSETYRPRSLQDAKTSTPGALIRGATVDLVTPSPSPSPPRTWNGLEVETIELSDS